MKKGKLELQFVLDTSTEKSYIIANNGSSEVLNVANTDGGISFMEVTPTGNIITTAITTAGVAVHSRNSIMFGDLLPSQYYGKCVKK